MLAGMRHAAKENVVLRVHRETGAGAAAPGQIVMRRHHHGLGVHHGDVGFVFDIDIDVAFAVAGRLLRHSAEVDGPEHGSIRGIDDGNVGRLVTEDVHVIVKRIVQHAIRIAHDFNGLDRHQGLGIEHLDRLAADESMARLGGYHDSVSIGAGNIGLRCQRV